MKSISQKWMKDPKTSLLKTKALCFFLCFFLPLFSGGHGLISLIECYKKDEKTLFRLELDSTGKKNTYSLYRPEKKNRTQGYKIALKDIFKNKRIVEKITVRDKNNKPFSVIEILEEPHRSVREGTTNYKGKTSKCSAVYPPSPKK